MKKITMLILCILTLGIHIGNAQVKRVNGTVTSSEDDKSIPGVSVLVKGTTIGTTTNLDGFYQIDVPEDANTLIFSFVGMRSQEIPIQGTVINVVLNPDVIGVDEVVVVAYGQQRKEAITGAVASIKSTVIEKRPVSAATAVLEGQALGVQVNNSFGEPGAEASIRIRGFNSINGDNSPLYVVNGVPMGGNVGDINPRDIESVTVLKDASSAALYGSKAAAGVILITTKGGNLGSDKVKFEVGFTQGVYERGLEEYDRLDPKQYMEAYWMARRNALYTGDPTKYGTWNGANADAIAAVSDGLVYNIFNKDWNSLYDTNGKLAAGAEILNGYKDDLDWYKDIERIGNRGEYYLNASGGSAKSSYYMSMGYLDEEGYLKGSSGDRITGNMKAETKPAKWIKSGLTLNTSYQTYNSMTAGTGNSNTIVNPFYFARNMAPIYPVHLHDPVTGEYILVDGEKQYDRGANGDLIRPQSNNRHIAWETELNKDKTYRTTVDATAFTDIYLPQNITFTIKGNLNNRNSSNKSYDNAIIGDGAGKGRMSQTDYRYQNYMIQELLNWNHSFRDVHNVEALIGHEYSYYNYQYTYLYKQDEKFANMMELSNFSTMTSMNGYQQGYNTEGYFARAGYNYDQKYYLEGSFRRDGSSRFYKDNRWGNFWSLGGSWIVSRENFMRPLTWINSLKLRAAYGEVGKESSADYYAWMALYYSTVNGGDGALYKNQNEAMDISWETTGAFSAAIETYLFNRLNFTIEYYNKISKDLLFDVSLPASMGATSTGDRFPRVTKNFGSVSNSGLEVGLNYDIIKNKDMVWNAGVMLNFQKSEVKELPSDYTEDGYITGLNKYAVGESMNKFYTYIFEGVDRSNGRSLYRLNDKTYYISDDGYTGTGAKEDDESRTALAAAEYTIIDGQAYVYKTTYAKRDWCGTSIPDMFGSFTTSFQYKSFTLSGLFTYQLGGKIFDYSYQSLMSAPNAPSALHVDLLNSWNPDQAGTGIDPEGTPALNASQSTDNNATSSRFLVDADYFNIKSITLGYDLPKTFVNNLGLGSITASASIENLAIFTKLKGMNPQQSWNGTSNNAYGYSRIMLVGLNVKF